MDPGYFDTERKQNPREKASLLSKFWFWYTLELFQKGRKGQLGISDLYRCSPDHRAAPRGDDLGVKWKEELQKREKGKKPSLLRAIVKIYGWPFIIGNAISSSIDGTIRLLIPTCLEGLINYFSPAHAGVSVEHAYLYAACVVGSMVVLAGVFHVMILWIFNMAMKIRVGCSSLIYRKLLRLDLTVGGKASEGLTGHVVNLLTTDAQRFDMACLFLVNLIRAPIESVLIIYLMYRQIGVATFTGVCFLLIFIPLQGYLGKISSKFRRKTAIRTDNRIRLMNEVIQSIEAIKMYAWENAFARILGEARKQEMNVIKKITWLRAVMLSCVKLNTKVAILLSIITYISAENELTAAKVFVIFSYYTLLKNTLVDYLPLAITHTLEAYVSVKRMQEFLLLPEVDRQDAVDLLTIDENNSLVKTNGVFEKIGKGQQAYIKSENNIEHLKPQLLISMKDYTANWKNADDESLDEKVVALSDINFVVKPNTLTTIVGTVGSGKSTLLLAMLKELSPIHGHLQVNGVVAYAAQDPWLFDASVRQNILFGQDLDLRRYKQVIKCCKLKSDLEILANGDKTIVGERGTSLSGGQRARISLARCVYQVADIYLLDDPLAAVDSKVAQAIYDECIRGFLRDSATVLVTHRVQYAKHADNVCVMKGGRIVAQGSYNELNDVPEFTKLIEMTKKDEEEKLEQKALGCENQETVTVAEGSDDELDEVSELTKLVGIPKKIEEQKLHRQKPLGYENQRTVEHNYNRLRSQRSMSEASQLSFNLDMDNQDPKYEGEAQNKGSVDGSVYLSYIKNGGTILSMFILCALFILAQIFASSTDFWLKYWVDLEGAYSAKKFSNANSSTEVVFESIPSNKSHLTREQCLYIYGGLIAICIFLTGNKLVVFYNTCIKSSVTLHKAMYRGVTSAPMWFFHHNPSGRILNRFSKDMGQVDTMLPVALVDCLEFFLELIAVLVVVCLVNWWLILPTACVAVLLLALRAVFITTSRELKRIEAIARSPSLNHLSSTVSGLTTIRSTQHQRTLAREFDKLQDLHSSSWSLVLVTNRAFGLWMDMLCCVYLAFVTFSFFVFEEDIFGGSVGLAITQAIGLVGMCHYGMRQMAEVENQMTSVERILEYTNLPAEHPMEKDEKLLKTNHPDLDFDKWPTKGEIVFENVSLEYERPPKEENEIQELKEKPAYAIRDVSFIVRPAEKVAVVGRTGAGKSSLVNALFRLSHTSGRVSVDGVTATEAGLRCWRARLCALPQRPALFAATLRDNLDPDGKYSDAEIYRAMEQVELRDMVGKMGGGLSSKVGDGGGNLSTGQRQLVCLARAALLRATVLVLDEATANVDTDTDKHIQETIRSKFANSTVLTIAHRLNTVMDYDKVIVMDKGRVAEIGHPFELLTQTNVTEKQKNQQRRSLLSKSQAPLAIPENFAYDVATGERLDEQKEKVLIEWDRIRTYSNRSEGSDHEAGSGGIFRTLVEQTGPDTAAMLYRIAEESYRNLQEKKKKS